MTSSRIDLGNTSIGTSSSCNWELDSPTFGLTTSPPPHNGECNGVEVGYSSLAVNEAVENDVSDECGNCTVDGAMESG